MKKVLVVMLAMIMCLCAANTVFAAEFRFVDVGEDVWFYEDVKNAVEMGLVRGKSDTEYKPDDNLTYAEAVKLAACMNQFYTDGAVTLKNGTPWYQPYVDYCCDKGIIDKEYNYSDNVTRAGYMGIFANALPQDGLAAINNVPDNSIPDVPVSRGYAAGIYKLYRAGILQGVDAEHNCDPLEPIKRSEVATILSRMMDENKRVKFSMDDEDEVKVLRMATSADFPPYEYKEGSGFKGIDIEIAEAIAEKLGCELEIMDMEFDEIFNSVIEGQADFVIAGITPTEERKNVVDFSLSYYTGVQSVIVAEGSSIETFDLYGEKIGVQFNTTGDIYSTDDFGEENVMKYDCVSDMVKALARGEVDAVIIDKSIAEKIVTEHKGLTVSDIEYSVEDYAIAVQKGNEELLLKINIALVELMADGTIDRIVGKYITAE